MRIYMMLFVLFILFGFPKAIIAQDGMCPNVISSPMFAYRERSPATIAVLGFDINPNGETMLVSTPVGVYLYDAQTLEFIRAIRCQGDHPVDLGRLFAWSPDGTQFALLYSPCVGVEIRDAESNEVVRSFPTPDDSPYCADPYPEEPSPGRRQPDQIVWSPDGRYLAVKGTRDVPTRVWNLESEELEISTSAFVAQDLEWSLDSQKLLALHECTVEEWVVGKDSFMPLYEIPCSMSSDKIIPNYYDELSLSSTNRLVIAGSYEGLYLWDLDTDEILVTDFRASGSGPNVDWNSEGSLLVAGDNILDADGKLVKHLEDNKASIEIAWHPSKKWLYIADYDSPLSIQLRILDVDSGEVVAFINSCTRWKSIDPSLDCDSLEG